jgi:hypothetical protein
LDGRKGVHRVGATNGVHADFGQADVADLPGGDQLGKRTDRLLDRGLAVEAVLVIQIDMVGRQPLQ